MANSVDKSLLKPASGSVRHAPRRRRRPEAASAEILDAAEKFLRRHTFHEMTVDDLMARTGLSRPSFYEYFRDRYELAMKLVERMTALMYPISDVWFSSENDPRTDLERGLAGVIAVYREHRHLMRALSDAAVQDKKVGRAFAMLIDRMTTSTAARIKSEISSGRTRPIDAYETARALILMNERYLNDRLEHDSRIDSKVLLETLVAIWMRVLYGTPEPRA